jgi:hypothetical protein
MCQKESPNLKHALHDFESRLGAVAELLDSKGVKYDSGKAPLHLLNHEALLATAKVFGFGAQKYAKHNWRKGIELTRLLDSVGRHLLELQQGNDIDEESGLPHAAHAIAGLMMFMGVQKHSPEFDDRYKNYE